MRLFASKGTAWRGAAESIAMAGSNNEAAHHRPTAEEIAARAYEIFIARGATPGNDLDDWLQAEREPSERNGNSTSLRAIAGRAIG